MLPVIACGPLQAGITYGPGLRSRLIESLRALSGSQRPPEGFWESDLIHFKLLTPSSCIRKHQGWWQALDSRLRADLVSQGLERMLWARQRKER